MLLDRFKKVMERQRAIRSAYHLVFNSPEGKLVLHDLLAAGGVLETSMTPNDPQGTAWREGRRSLALEIIHKLRWTEGEMMALALARTQDHLAQAESED